MSKSRWLLALVFLGSIALVPVTSRANASDPGFGSPSICDAVVGNLVKNCGFETGDFPPWTATPAESLSLVPFGPPIAATSLHSSQAKSLLTSTSPRLLRLRPGGASF